MLNPELLSRVIQSLKDDRRPLAVVYWPQYREWTIEPVEPPIDWDKLRSDGPPSWRSDLKDSP